MRHRGMHSVRRFFVLLFGAGSCAFLRLVGLFKWPRDLVDTT